MWLCYDAFMGQLTEYQRSERPAGIRRATVFKGRLETDTNSDAKYGVSVPAFKTTVCLERRHFTTSEVPA